MKELAALAYRDTTVENREFWKNEMGQALREIQDIYEDKLNVMRSELESYYNLKVKFEIHNIWGIAAMSQMLAPMSQMLAAISQMSTPMSQMLAQMSQMLEPMSRMLAPVPQMLQSVCHVIFWHRCHMISTLSRIKCRVLIGLSDPGVPDWSDPSEHGILTFQGRSEATEVTVRRFEGQTRRVGSQGCISITNVMFSTSPA